MKISDMTFAEGFSTPEPPFDRFKLADGHEYTIHRLERDGKTPVYSLLGGPQGALTAFTPYVTAHQMDAILAMRLAPGNAVVGTLDEKSPTGYVCPGCGAVTTETGVHVGPANPPASDAIPANPDGPGIVVDNGQIELLPKPRQSRFFDRS